MRRSVLFKYGFNVSLCDWLLCTLFVPAARCISKEHIPAICLCCCFLNQCCTPPGFPCSSNEQVCVMHCGLDAQNCLGKCVQPFLVQKSVLGGGSRAEVKHWGCAPCQDAGVSNCQVVYFSCIPFTLHALGVSTSCAFIYCSFTVYWATFSEAEYFNRALLFEVVSDVLCVCGVQCREGLTDNFIFCVTLSINYTIIS